MRVIGITTATTLVTQIFTGIPIATINTTWYLRSSTSNLSMFLYELWWYDTNFSSVQSSLISYITSKPAEFTSIPESDPYKSYNSLSCSTSCTSQSQSCSSTSTNCLNFCSLNCFSGCYNFSSPRCIFDCPYNCLTCESGTDRCTSCNSVSTYDSSTNTCNCRSGAGIIIISTSPSICTAAVSNCQSYIAEGCSVCNIGYYLQCPTSPCPPNGKVCTSCPMKCISCSLSDAGVIVCSLCDSGYAIMTGSISYSCVLNCPEGFYKDTSSPATCRACESNCGECYSSTVCSKCIHSTYLLDGDCLASCGIGYYENSSNWECEECSENCERCEYEGGSLVCKGCNSSTFLIEGRCEIDCGRGYYGDTSDRECKACSENCRECEILNVCERCEMGYALKGLSGSVVCDVCLIGEYGDGSSCIACPDTCTNCNSGTECTSCISNATLSGSMCYCNVGYTHISGVCLLGFDVSATMNTDGTVTLTFSESLSTELNANSLNFKDGLVTYDSSTFNLSTISSLLSYKISFTKILLTDLNLTKLYFPTSPNILTSYSGKYLSQSYLDISITAISITQYCSSIINCSSCSLSIDANFKCDGCRGVECIYSYPSIRCGSCCDDGYFQETIDSKNICTQCEEKCLSCDDRCKECSILSCSECMNDYYLLDSSCLEECPSGYYTNTHANICEVCTIPYCKSCYNSPVHDGIVCSECISDFFLTSETRCSPCDSGTFYNDGICSICPSLCKHCSSSSECLECIPTARLKSKLCECNIGLIESSGRCISGFMQVSIEISKDGTILLSLSVPLLNPLVSNSISITINGVTYYFDSFILSELKSNQSYSISIPGLHISPNSTVIINFLDESSIIGVDGSALPSDEISISAPDDSNNSSSKPSDSITSQQDYLAQEPYADSLASGLATTTKVVVSVSAAMSFSSPSGLWSFINSIQLISVMPFLNVDLPVIVFAGFVGLREYIPLPNLSLASMQQKGPEPYYRASLMGYETCQFFINSGSIWSGFITTLGLYPLLILVKKLLHKKYRKTTIYKKVSGTIKDYKWNVFMRFFIESYIELGIASAIQTLYIAEIDHGDSNLMLNAISGIIMLALVVVFPIFLALFIYRHRKDVNNKKFMKKWGTIFEEFNTNNEKSICSFYYVYSLLRVGILLISFFLLKNWPRLQIGLASAACWTVINNQKVIFDVMIRPFEEKLMNYVNIIVEFCVACCYTLVISFTFDLDEDATSIVQWFIVGFAALSYLVNTGYIVYNTIVYIIKNLKNRRSHNRTRVGPELEPELRHMREEYEVRNVSNSSLSAIHEDNHMFIKRDKIMHYNPVES